MNCVLPYNRCFCSPFFPIAQALNKIKYNKKKIRFYGTRLFIFTHLLFDSNRITLIKYMHDIKQTYLLKSRWKLLVAISSVCIHCAVKTFKHELYKRICNVYVHHQFTIYTKYTCAALVVCIWLTSYICSNFISFYYYKHWISIFNVTFRLIFTIDLLTLIFKCYNDYRIFIILHHPSPSSLPNYPTYSTAFFVCVFFFVLLFLFLRYLIVYCNNK